MLFSLDCLPGSANRSSDVTYRNPDGFGSNLGRMCDGVSENPTVPLFEGGDSGAIRRIGVWDMADLLGDDCCASFNNASNFHICSTSHSRR